MVKKYVFLTIFFTMCFSTLSYSGELAAEEAVTYYNIGVQAQKKGDYFDAIRSYKKALIMAPQSSEYGKYISNNLGLIYIQRGDFDRAESYFKRALTIDPCYRTAQLNLGLIYDLKQGKSQTIQYWLNLFRVEIERMKPKAYILEGPCETDKTIPGLTKE